MNRSTDAISKFQRAVAIDQNYVSALSNLAVTLYREGRYIEAAEMYEKMIRPDDRDYRLRGNLAATYQKIPGKQAEAARRFQEAVQIAEEKLRVNPRDSDVLSQLAVYYAELGNRARALERLEPALAMASSRPDVGFRAAQVHERLGNRDAAIEWLGKALEAGYPPENLEHSPDLRELRSDPRLAEMMRKSKKQ